MSVATAIGQVSSSLRNLLAGEMTLDPQVDVTILAPDENATDRRVNLFLYRIKENDALKNLDWRVKPGSPGVLLPPPLSVNLFYLMTVYARSADHQTGNITAHQIMGEAMRVFYENPVVPGEYLDEELLDAGEQIRIMLSPIDLEELSNVWNTFKEPYRLSVCYEISVVQLDMLPAAERQMAERVRTIGIPAVEAPFQPPEVDRIDPISGPAGSAVRIYGNHFVGWRAAVSVMGRTFAESERLSSDAFDITLPDDLLPGFHNIRVDISNLTRKTVLFEVTA